MVDRKGIGGLNISEDETLAGGDLFDKIQANHQYQSGFTQEYYPLTGVTSGGPYEFLISSDGPHYIILPQTRLYGKVKIVKSDGGANLGGPAYINMLPSSIFKHVEIEVNGISVSDASSNCYGVKAYLDTLLSYGYVAKHTHLQSNWFDMDTAGRFDDFGELNKMAKERRLHLQKSKEKEFETLIYSDFFQIHRLLPSGCNIRLKFVRSADSFVLLHATDEYKIVLTDLRVCIRKVLLTPALLARYDSAFSSGRPAILPFTRSQIKTFVIAAGLSTVNQPSIISGQIPQCMIIGLVDSDAANGEISKNPYNFRNYNISSINLKVNGVCTPATPYKMDFPAGTYLRAYRALTDNTGIGISDGGNAITPFDYKNGSTLFAFDLTPDMCNGFQPHPRRHGVIDLEITFGKAITDPVNIIVYATYDNVLAIDKYRNVTSDASP